MNFKILGLGRGEPRKGEVGGKNFQNLLPSKLFPVLTSFPTFIHRYPSVSIILHLTASGQPLSPTLKNEAKIDTFAQEIHNRRKQ